MQGRTQGRKIAVLRANGIGDFIFALPALQALRETFPDDEIVYLGKAMHRELLDGRPSPIDRVIEIPPCPGVGEDPAYQADDAQLRDFFARMRDEKFDVALQMHGGGRYSNPFLMKLGAELTIGLQAEDAAPLDVNVPYLTYFSEILRYLEVVSHLDVRIRSLVPRLPAIEQDRREAARVIPPGKGAIAVIHPGATDIRRRWPPRHFAGLALHLAQRGMRVLISGAGDVEGAIAAEILAHCASLPGIHDISNRLSLPGLLGLLDQADLMVSNDSGPLHLAEAVGLPSVGIYLSCNMINAMPMQAALSRPVVAWNSTCPLCGEGFARLEASEQLCPHDASFTTDVDLEDVIEAVNALRPRGVSESRAATGDHAMHEKRPQAVR